MNRCAVLFAVWATACTKPMRGPSVDRSAAEGPGSGASGSSMDAMPKSAPKRFADRQDQVSSESSLTRVSSTWSVGVRREADAVQDKVADPSNEPMAETSKGDLNASRDRGSGMDDERHLQFDGADPSAQESSGAAETVTQYDGGKTTSDSESPSLARRSWSQVADDGDDESPLEGAESAALEASADEPSCGPGEIAAGYDLVGDEKALCVPRQLVETCQQLGQLPVIVSDMGMDCYVPQRGQPEQQTEDHRPQVNDLPNCEPDTVIIALPEVDETPTVLECRLFEQLEPTTADALAQVDCGEQIPVIRVFQDSPLEEAIRGDVSCL